MCCEYVSIPFVWLPSYPDTIKIKSCSRVCFYSNSQRYLFHQIAPSSLCPNDRWKLHIPSSEAYKPIDKIQYVVSLSLLNNNIAIMKQVFSFFPWFGFYEYELENILKEATHFSYLFSYVAYFYGCLLKLLYSASLPEKSYSYSPLKEKYSDSIVAKRITKGTSNILEVLLKEGPAYVYAR